MENKKPLVSVFCFAYNHEKYIRDCLEGFVSQKTDFPFEVIVHDDASADNTKSIIQEYAERYPDVIIPIYQTENQYSLGVQMIRKFIVPLVRGRYVAICEGDDYWTDNEKLQKQVTALEKNKDCHFCVCGVKEVSVNKTPLGVFHPNVKIDNPVISSEDFIKYVGTYSFQTSSYVMRYEDWKEYELNSIDFKDASDIGDLPMLLYYGNLGNVAYIDRFMSCYRRGAPTSYSTAKNNWTEDEKIKHFEKQISVWKLFDSFSGKRFHSTCVLKASQNMFGYLILQERASDFLKSENMEYFKAMPVLKQAYILLSCLFSKAMKKYYIYSVTRSEQKELKLWNDEDVTE